MIAEMSGCGEGIFQGQDITVEDEFTNDTFDEEEEEGEEQGEGEQEEEEQKCEEGEGSFLLVVTEEGDSELQVLYSKVLRAPGLMTKVKYSTVCAPGALISQPPGQGHPYTGG